MAGCTDEEAAALDQSARAGRIDLRTAVDRLKKGNRFGLARRLLESVPLRESHEPTRVYLIQQQALCTYKDPDLPRHAAFKKALRILGGLTSHPSDTSHAETRALEGAIYKRRWQVFGNLADLERAQSCYAAASGHADKGYAEINQAFLLDALAYTEEISPAPGVSAARIKQRRDEAAALRTKVVALLGDPLEHAQSAANWWYRATLAEAHFGLGHSSAAEQEINDARLKANPEGWQLNSFARQLAQLALYRHPHASFEAMRALGVLDVLKALDIGPAAVETAVVGKLGLALSGGGFRASLFHIGVLARLAELDVLRHVEVISCVSGGSIIGAYYYLALKNLLATKADGALTQGDYLELVQSVCTGFLAGVQQNLRVRVVADFEKNLDMLDAEDDYSRTHRLAELYDEHLYARVAPKGLRMADLKIAPAGDDQFNLKDDNWRRAHKVPMLILNAATLNTGHAWQFTASYMGEPPSHIDDDVDTNARLRRVYYPDAPGAHRDLPLRHAVAASSCVPGLFAPLLLSELYQDQSVLLVDGGVFDNQGTTSLLEQDCTVVLVSDASGQLTAKSLPAKSALPVLGRTNDVFQSRIRDAQFRELDARRLSGVLGGLMYVHLRSDLREEAIPWIGCPAPPNTTARKQMTDYGMDREVQESLAGLRTDLDSFTDAEAYTLMLSGYRMATWYFEKQPGLAIVPRKEQRWDWPFHAVADLVDGAPADEPRRRTLTHLREGASPVFKGWRAAVPGWLNAILLGLGALILLAVAVYLFAINPTLISLSGRAAVIAVVLLAARFALKVDVGSFLPEAALKGRLRRYLWGWLLAGVANLHLKWFDPKFLARGAVAALRSGRQKPLP